MTALPATSPQQGEETLPSPDAFLVIDDAPGDHDETPPRPDISHILSR
ncbi:MAG: hypothetical protein R3B70_16110 [Polyangiaceae bacterium]